MKLYVTTTPRSADYGCTVELGIPKSVDAGYESVRKVGVVSDDGSVRVLDVVDVMRVVTPASDQDRRSFDKYQVPRYRSFGTELTAQVDSFHPTEADDVLGHRFEYWSMLAGYQRALVWMDYEERCAMDGVSTNALLAAHEYARDIGRGNIRSYVDCLEVGR